MNSQNSNKGARWFWGIFLSIIIFSLLFSGISFLILAKAIVKAGTLSTDYEVTGSGKDKIAVVNMDFTIISSETIVKQFKKYREDESVKAIVLRINSPGGGVAASQEMYEEIRKTRDSGKPIVTSFGSIAASGGYYIACGTSYIVSNPGSLTGSIGVIMQFLTIKDLAEKLGIKETTIKSGPLKDSGNPFRDVNEQDTEYFQEIIDDTYEQFVDVVSRERKIPREELLEIANGRVFTGKQALKLRLVDTLGTFEDAIIIATQLGKIEGEPAIIKEKTKKTLFQIFLENISRSDLSEFKNEIMDEFIEKPILQYKFER